MKTLKTVSMMFVAVAFVSSVSAQAQDYRPSNSGPSRTFLGLPVPQQWTGVRPTANQNTGYGAQQGYNAIGLNSSSCANGQCSNGSKQAGYGSPDTCANGRCTSGTCSNCNCPAGACASGLCASGQCAACANGQCANCANGRCDNGQSVGGNCPNGQCRQNLNARTTPGQNYGVSGNRVPRNTRSNVADPFRQAEFDNENNNWTPRAATRNLNNVQSPSRYNQNDMDLRRPYFYGQSGELNDARNSENSSVSRDIRAPRPSDRSMFGVPVERAEGLAQI